MPPPVVKEFQAIGAACPSNRKGFNTGDNLSTAIGATSIVCKRIGNSPMAFFLETSAGPTVAEFEVVTHDNGVSKIEGFVSDDEKQMVSIGISSIDASCNVSEFFEGQHCVFHSQTQGRVSTFVR